MTSDFMKLKWEISKAMESCFQIPKENPPQPEDYTSPIITQM